MLGLKNGGLGAQGLFSGSVKGKSTGTGGSPAMGPAHGSKALAGGSQQDQCC